MKAEFGPYAAVAFAPLLLIGMNIVYALSAYTFGKLSDSMSHAKLLALGLAVLIGADLALAYSNHWTWVWAGISLWGLSDSPFSCHFLRNSGSGLYSPKTVLLSATFSMSLLYFPG